jgi:hypothetical protein
MLWLIGSPLRRASHTGTYQSAAQVMTTAVNAFRYR